MYYGSYMLDHTKLHLQLGMMWLVEHMQWIYYWGVLKVLILTTIMQNNIMACFQCISLEDIGNNMSYPLKDKVDIYIHFPKFTQPLFMEDKGART